MNILTKAHPSFRRPLFAILAMATAIPGLGAGIGFNIYEADAGNGNGTTSVQTYVDWSMKSTVANHANYEFWTNPNGASTFYADYQTFGDPAPATSKCFEISTTDWGVNLAADPIIWVKTSDGLWKKLADDVFGAHAFAKVFVPQNLFFNAYSKIRLAAYSSQRSNDAFRFRSNWTASDMGTCAGGNTPAAVISANGTVTIVRAQ